MIDKKSYFSKFKLAILFSVGLGVGFYIANIENERSQFVQIVPSEYKSFEFQKADYDAFKVYDIDNLLSDEIDDRDAHLISGQKIPTESDISHFEPETHEQIKEISQTALESENQFYEHLENNTFKNLRAEPPYSVPQIDEKVSSLRVKRVLPPGNKGQRNENIEAEGIVGRK